MKQSKIAILRRIPRRYPGIAVDRFYAAVDLLAGNPISALLSTVDSASAYELSFPQTIYEQKVQTTIGIDKHSYLLDWVEVKHSYSQDIYKAMWGDPLQRFDYSGWLLDGSVCISQQSGRSPATGLKRVRRH